MSLAETLQAYAMDLSEPSLDRVDRRAMSDERRLAEQKTAEQKVWLKRYQTAIASGDKTAALQAAKKLPAFLNDAGMRVSPVDRVEKDLNLFPKYGENLEQTRDRFESSRTARALGRLVKSFREQLDVLIAQGAAEDRKLTHLGLECFVPLGFSVNDDLRQLRLEDHEAMEAERTRLIGLFPWLRPVELHTAEDVEDRPRGKRSKSHDK